MYEGVTNVLVCQLAGLWDCTDTFYYDRLHMSHHQTVCLRIRSLVGLLPVIAVHVFCESKLRCLPRLANHLRKSADTSLQPQVSLNTPPHHVQEITDTIVFKRQLELLYFKQRFLIWFRCSTTLTVWFETVLISSSSFQFLMFSSLSSFAHFNVSILLLTTKYRSIVSLSYIISCKIFNVPCSTNYLWAWRPKGYVANVVGVKNVFLTFD